jgi:uncharacterized membrane protein YjjP (DUF1212 family)
MDIEERSTFVLTAAKGLFVNGESTEQTVTAAARLADVLGLHAKLSVRWDELALQIDSANGALVRLEGAEPTGVEMDRVASVMRVIDELAAGDLNPEEARAEIEAVSHARPAPTWLFAIAAAAGAAALSVIFGVDNLAAAVVLAVSAGMGALLRRGLASRRSTLDLRAYRLIPCLMVSRVRRSWRPGRPGGRRQRPAPGPVPPGTESGSDTTRR